MIQHPFLSNAASICTGQVYVNATFIQKDKMTDIQVFFFFDPVSSFVSDIEDGHAHLHTEISFCENSPCPG